MTFWGPENNPTRVVRKDDAVTELAVSANLRRSGGNNTWTVEDCEISNFRAAGVEIRGFGSTSVVSSKIGPPAAPVPDAPDIDPTAVAPLVLSAETLMVHGCRLISDGAHMVLPPLTRPSVGLPVRRQSEQGGEDAAWALVADSSEGGNFWLSQNMFLSAAMGTSRPRVLVGEYPRGDAAVRPVLRDLWASSGGHGTWLASTIDVGASTASPETTWSVENMLRNTMFEGPGGTPLPAPAHWSWVSDPAHGFKARVVEVVEPELTGPAIRVEQSGHVPPVFGAIGDNTLRIRLVQRVVEQWSPETRAVAWDGRSRVRGKNVMGACWVKTAEGASVQLSFEEVPSDSIAQRANDSRLRVLRGPDSSRGPRGWRFLTVHFNPVSRDFYHDVKDAPGTRGWWAIDFVITIAVPAPSGINWIGSSGAGSSLPPRPTPYALIAAPQVTLGPTLLPVGPPTVKVAGGEAVVGQLRGPLELARGFVDEAYVDVGASGVARLPFGHDGELQGLKLDLGIEPPLADAAFVAERVLDGKTMVLAEFQVKRGEVEASPKADLPVGIRRGGLLRLRRTAGAPVPATLVATVLRSKVI